MEQILEQAALDYASRSLSNHVVAHRTTKDIANISFQAGAEWQKEQYRPIKEALELARRYMHLYMKKMGQNIALDPHKGSAMDDINKAIELLQD